MQVTETKTEGLSREYTVQLPAKDIEEKVSNRLKEIATTAQLPGFRPGKVPVALLRKRYGPSIMGEILERAVNDSSQQALAEKGIRPAMQPEIEITSFDEGKDLEYTMNVQALPEITPVDFKTLELERWVPEISDDELKTALENIANSQKTSEPVSKKRKSKAGDIVVIDFTGSVDGEEFPGGKAEGYSLELGSNSFIPGFEDQLIGKTAGDTLDVKVTFPAEYGAADLAGKDAVFAVTIHELRETAPAAIDDELATKLGMENLEKLKEAITEEQSREFREVARMKMKRALLDMLADGHDFEVPSKLVDQEFESIWKQFEDERKKAEENGEKADDDGLSDDDHKAEFRTIAERRVRLGLLLAEIGRVNEIQIAQEDLNKAVMEETRRYPGQEQEVMEFYQKNPEAMQQLSAPLYEDKVVDFIFEMSKVTDKKGSMADLMKAIEKEEAEKADKKPAKAKKAKAAAKSTAKKTAEKKKPAAKKAPAKKATAKKKD